MEYLDLSPKQSRWKRYFRRGPLYSAKSQITLLLMVLPAMLTVLVFSYFPMYGVTIAFREIQMRSIWSSPWADPVFKYFQFLKDPAFWQVFKNTVTIAVSKFIFGFAPPIILALLLNELRNTYFKRVVQTISYLPHFISWVILSGIIYSLLNLEFGPLMVFARAIGLPATQPIMGNVKAFVPMVVISAIWQGVGWGTIIYLAAISGIDPTLYEAAEIDGAGRFKMIWNITIPYLVPTISILLVLSVPGLINAGFDQIYNLKNDMVLSVAQIIDTYVLNVGLEKGNYSFASAVGLFNNILGMTLLLSSNFISKRMGGQGIW
jgi:putative aldouronate transport system permease protein